MKSINLNPTNQKNTSKNIKHMSNVNPLLNTLKRKISAGETNMWNIKKCAAIAAVGTGLMAAATSPASAQCGWGGWGAGAAVTVTAVGAAVRTATYMAKELMLWRTCPDIINRVTLTQLIPHDIIGWPSQGPTITASIMRPRTACDTA